MAGDKRNARPDRVKAARQAAPTTRNTRASLRQQPKQQTRRKGNSSSEQSLQQLEKDVRTAGKDEESFWEELKRIAKDIYNGGKQVASDLGLSPKDLLSLAML